MTIEEWTVMVEKEYREAGFEVIRHQGFPMAKHPPTFEEKYKFLKFKPGFGVSYHMYKEGVLILPPGIEGL